MLRKYRVVYFKSIPARSLTMVSREYVMNIPSYRRSAVLRNLDPDTKYEVKVFGVASVNGIRMRGERTKLTFTTNSLPKRM